MKICFKCKVPISEEIMVSGLHHDCFCEWFLTHEPSEFSDVVARFGYAQDKEKDWAQINTSFFHGKFRKYSARIGANNYILKVMQPEVPELPLTEYLCNQLARALSIEVPNHYMILFQNKLETFVSLNFMDSKTGSDLVHIYRYLESTKDYNCEHLLKVIENEVKRYEAIVRFIEITLFDALIGNHDRHGRNLGLIKSREGTTLAPFYDNPCYLALEIPELLGAYHEPRGAIATKETHEPIMKDYVREWIRLGFKDEVIKFTSRINEPMIENHINTSLVSEARKIAFLKLVKRRFKELINAI